jgi:RNA polymerase sigma factor (sigma-70 family)
VQDVLAGLFERGDVTEPIRDLSAFVWRSLRNRVTDRRRARRAPASLDAGAGEAVADGRSDTGALVERRALGVRIDAAIESLGDDERDVFVATELEGRKFRELAETWDTPMGTLLARKYRAVRHLRSALADIDRDGEGETT